MLIQPDTVIKLLHNCPLDKTYDHTLYFASESAQVSYFTGLTKHNLTKQNYQRYDRGWLTIQVPAEELYDCNYLMFRNTAFGTKWFYAFVTSIEYVNNVTSRVKYELDVMQTWYFDYSLGHCFVEREHAFTDTVGVNTVPENLELGEYISSSFDIPMNSSGRPIMSGKSIIVASTFDKSGTDTTGGIYCGIYSGVIYNVFDATTEGMEEASEFILNNAKKAEGIVSVFMMPTAFVGDILDSAKVYDFTFNKTTNPYGFTPNNNKLLTYPYNFLYVSNMQGNSAVYPFEFFVNGKCDFILAGDMSCNPSVVLAPKNYKGVHINYDEKLVLTGFPQCAYATDSFKAWLAQNAASLVTSAIGIGGQTALAQGRYTQAWNNPYISVAGAELMGGGMALSLASNVASTMSEVYRHSTMPDQAHTGTGSTSMYALGLMNFALMQKHIRDEYARMIDEYFDMFGYATHRVKIPNRSSRPHWNYVKTVGCVLTGSIPADDTAKICAIYDKGITFWKKGSEVGNYSLDNRA